MSVTPFEQGSLFNRLAMNEKLAEIKKEIDGETKVGDIKITTRTDLGDKWLLCNGESVSSVDYPALSATKYDPSYFGTPAGCEWAADINLSNMVWTDYSGFTEVRSFNAYSIKTLEINGIEYFVACGSAVFYTSSTSYNYYPANVYSTDMVNFSIYRTTSNGNWYNTDIAVFAGYCYVLMGETNIKIAPVANIFSDCPFTNFTDFANNSTYVYPKFAQNETQLAVIGCDSTNTRLQIVYVNADSPTVANKYSAASSSTGSESPTLIYDVSFGWRIVCCYYASNSIYIKIWNCGETLTGTTATFLKQTNYVNYSSYANHQAPIAFGGAIFLNGPCFKTGDAGYNKFYKIDPDTGAITEMHTVDGNDMVGAIAHDGKLYVMTDDTTYIYDSGFSLIKTTGYAPFGMLTSRDSSHEFRDRISFAQLNGVFYTLLYGGVNGQTATQSVIAQNSRIVLTEGSIAGAYAYIKAKEDS